MLALNSMKDIEREVAKRMDKSLEAVQREFKAIRTGRASTALVEAILVSYYGNPTPMKGVASLSTPDPKTIAIQPWDPSVIGDIEKAIQESDLGVQPIVDGKVVRIQVPQMTEERRMELTKTARKMAEEGKISIRAGRHEAIEAAKRLEKNKQISEDESHAGQKRIQKLTDEHTKKVDEFLKAKESELGSI